MRLGLLSLLLVAGLAFAGCDAGRRELVVSEPPPVTMPASGLPLPSTVSREALQQQLYHFLASRVYAQKGWRRDKRIRDTGPYQDGVYYGTHPAVRIYYSPEMIAWLEGNRAGEIPDGAMLVKEMFPPPAARYAGKDDHLPVEWTVMVRDKAGSKDGWYWSFYGVDSPQPPDNDDPPFKYPNSGFGLYCVRCHASAESTLTFASTSNIEGFPGEPQVYPVDDSWMTGDNGGPDPHPNGDTQGDIVPRALAQGIINQEFLDYFDQFPAIANSDVARIPGVTTSHAVADGHRQFVTSDQCLSCHAGDSSPFGPNMLSEDSTVDLSPWGEWAWSMMGLAGRDPIFYAQLETEMALHSQPGGDFNAATIANFCLRCHGVMGQRQHSLDKPGEQFTVAQAMAAASDDPNHIYGGLARDGISCAVCHQIQDQSNLPLSSIDTGRFIVKPAVDGLLTIFGPYQNPTLRPMQQALGMKAVGSSHVEDSLLCASCHTVDLPVLDAVTGKTLETKLEQATYPEWLNSSFGQPGTDFKSCQDCHMPTTYHTDDPLTFKIANVQDQDFPPADGLAPIGEITVKPRSGYRRHTLAGINVFALEMFRQFPQILGVNTKSFMTGLDNGLDNAIDGALLTAARSARIEVLSTSRTGNLLQANLKVISLTGHRFPSGVGFRRLILQVLVRDGAGNLVWSSGRTNDLGLVIDQNGQPLSGEKAEDLAVQPHYQVIDSPSEAQIYEERNRDSTGRPSTSFLGRAEEVKDNRLLPKGWTLAGPPGMEAHFVEATKPFGEAAEDPDFVDGTGSDTILYRMSLPDGAAGPFTVEASLYYQAIPPYYLQQRFEQARGPATQRLHHIGSLLDVKNSPFPQWKLLVTQASRSIVP